MKSTARNILTNCSYSLLNSSILNLENENIVINEFSKTLQEFPS
ncbi:hypothetical protein SAMN05720268_2517 [Polaribacter sp. KT 15]|nr:hypothetical protein SAMN05720268_2517 [Polaribacter sp. KT 15]